MSGFFFKSQSALFDPLVTDVPIEVRGTSDVPRASHRAGMARAYQTRSPRSSSSSASEPDTPDLTSTRPKLCDSLSKLTFSPKRPRSPALARTSSFNANGRSRHSKHPPSFNPGGKSSNIHTEVPVVPVRLPPNVDYAHRPPTPSTADSKFTKLARGLAHEIELEQTRQNFDGNPQNKLEAVPQSTMKRKAKKVTGNY